MFGAAQHWSAKSPSATHKLFFCQLIPPLPAARPGNCAIIESKNRTNRKKRDRQKSIFANHKKRKRNKLESSIFELRKLCLKFGRTRIAFDERLECQRTLIATCTIIR